MRCNSRTKKRSTRKNADFGEYFGIMKETELRGSENKGSGNSVDLRELEALFKRVEVLKNQMRNLLERARETIPRVTK
jgi:hypothetical protein